jgi:eukaryotic-like serine/threonine-protein kinase
VTRMTSPVPATTCPGDDVLVAFVHGKLEAAQARAIDDHLDGCSRCSQSIVALAGVYLTQGTTGAPSPLSITSDNDDVTRTELDPRVRASPPATWALPPIIGEYRIDRLLGHGGMGSVWRAHDTLLDRDVAIKIGEVASEERRLRARVEARAIARLSHPNIVRVHHASEVDERPLLVTELLAGQSLDHLELPVEPGRVAAIGADLARGLAAAHARGVLHRDLKPGNAFLCDHGVVKILDFGLAQIEPAAVQRLQARDAEERDLPGVMLDDTVPDETTKGSAEGTPLYMAPETWRGEAATRSTDIYSLGALLYQLLTGHTPYTGRTASELRSAVLHGRLEVRPVPGAPAGLVDLILTCLDLAPSTRPTAEEVCHALEGIFSPPEEETLDEVANPYRGLFTFGREHRAVFFGRESETLAVLDAIHASPWVLVVGASGAGKSSLVRAGVLPSLERKAKGSGAWRVVALVPGTRPVERLGHALLGLLRAVGAADPGTLVSSPSGTRQLARSITTKTTGRLLVFVDQLEEAWTRADKVERRNFFEALTALAGMGQSVRVVTTLRADFLGKIGELDARGVPIGIGPMSAAGLRKAVVGPAQAYGVTVEPLLADALVVAARDGGVGSLPLLEFALAALWERKSPASKTLGLSDLVAIGGLEGALGAHADATLEKMTPAQKRAARRLMLALLTVERTRRRREDRELALSDSDSRTALDALVRARLVVANTGDEGTAYEIAHEAIVAGWPTLKNWLEEESAAREAAERLARGAAEWERLGGGVEGLWEASLFGELEVLDRAKMSAREQAFVAASRKAAALARRRLVAGGIGLLVALVGVVGGVLLVGAWRDRETTSRGVAAHVAEATAFAAEAFDLDGKAEDADKEAFARFDAQDWVKGEAEWSKALSLAKRAESRFGAAASAVSLALARDLRDPRARDVSGDITLRWLFAAERDHEEDVVRELQGRLSQVDDDGSRRARLSSPAHVRVSAAAPGASARLHRVQKDDRGRRTEDEGRAIALGAASLELEPGSYVLEVSAEGRHSTRLPLRLRRADDIRVEVPLPLAAAVPRGFAYVPAGKTFIGAPDVEPVRSAFKAAPEHIVEVGSFFIAELETTFGDYLEFLAALPPAEREARRPHVGTRIELRLAHDGTPVLMFDGVAMRAGEPLCRPKRSVHRCQDWRRMPVVGITWNDAVAYNTWLAATRTPGARLCTEREWERAARGADERPFPWGDDAHPGDANYNATYQVDADQEGEDEVGSFPVDRSPFGVMDLGGNVGEWVADDVDPKLAGLTRGGFWTSEAFFVRAADRRSPDEAATISVGTRTCVSLASPP